MPTLQQRRLLLAQQRAITYLLGPFTFSTAHSAPLTSPYIESGAPGSLTITDTANNLSITSGELVAASSNNAETAVSGSFARVVGRAVLATIRQPGTSRAMKCGWYDPTAPAEREHFYIDPGASQKVGVTTNSTDIATLVGTVPTTGVPVAVILRSTGAFYVYNGALVWVSNTGGQTPLTARSRWVFAPNTGALDNFRVTDLGGVWSTDYGIATQRLAGARGANDTFVHTANTLLEFVVTTLPSAGSIDVQFRVQDASNYWIARISTTGAFSLIEVVATVETSRGTAAGVISNGHRVVIIADGTTIAGYSNSASRWTYASASNFQSSSAGLLGSVGTGGAVSDLVTWPRNPALPSGV